MDLISSINASSCTAMDSDIFSFFSNFSKIEFLIHSLNSRNKINPDTKHIVPIGNNAGFM